MSEYVEEREDIQSFWSRDLKKAAAGRAFKEIKVKDDGKRVGVLINLRDVEKFSFPKLLPGQICLSRCLERKNWKDDEERKVIEKFYEVLDNSRTIKSFLQTAKKEKEFFKRILEKQKKDKSLTNFKSSFCSPVSTPDKDTVFFAPTIHIFHVWDIERVEENSIEQERKIKSFMAFYRNCISLELSRAVIKRLSRRSDIPPVLLSFWKRAEKAISSLQEELLLLLKEGTDPDKTDRTAVVEINRFLFPRCSTLDFYCISDAQAWEKSYREEEVFVPRFVYSRLLEIGKPKGESGSEFLNFLLPFQKFHSLISFFFDLFSDDVQKKLEEDSNFREVFELRERTIMKLLGIEAGYSARERRKIPQELEKFLRSLFSLENQVKGKVIEVIKDTVRDRKIYKDLEGSELLHALENSKEVLEKNNLLQIGKKIHCSFLAKEKKSSAAVTRTYRFVDEENRRVFPIAFRIVDSTKQKYLTMREKKNREEAPLMISILVPERYDPNVAFAVVVVVLTILDAVIRFLEEQGQGEQYLLIVRHLYNTLHSDSDSYVRAVRSVVAAASNTFNRYDIISKRVNKVAVIDQGENVEALYNKGKEFYKVGNLRFGEFAKSAHMVSVHVSANSSNPIRCSFLTEEVKSFCFIDMTAVKSGIRIGETLDRTIYIWDTNASWGEMKATPSGFSLTFFRAASTKRTFERKRGVWRDVVKFIDSIEQTVEETQKGVKPIFCITIQNTYQDRRRLENELVVFALEELNRREVTRELYEEGRLGVFICRPLSVVAAGERHPAKESFLLLGKEKLFEMIGLGEEDNTDIRPVSGLGIISGLLLDRGIRPLYRQMTTYLHFAVREEDGNCPGAFLENLYPYIFLARHAATAETPGARYIASAIDKELGGIDDMITVLKIRCILREGKRGPRKIDVDFFPYVAARTDWEMEVVDG